MNLRDLTFKRHLQVLSRNGCLWFVMIAGGASFAQDVAAQQSGVVWQSVIDGRHETISNSRRMPLDSLQVVQRKVLAAEREKGYYMARLDSVVVGDTTTTPVRVLMYVKRGPRLPVSSIEIAGLEALTRTEVDALMSIRTGRILSPSVLLADIDRILRAYELKGYPFARLKVGEISIASDTDNPGLALRLEVDEAQRVRINDIVLSGSRRTSIAFVQQLTGLRKGAWLNRDLDEVQQALVTSRFFSQVGTPRLIEIGQQEVILQIPVVEEAPGAFDLVLGYQPASAGGTSQGLVGNGHLNLRNMFGGGRQIAIRLNRLPGQISSVNAAFADPFLFGLPFSLEGAFEGLQQDSTYGQQAYRGAVGYRITGGLETLLTISREVTKPGQAGLRLQNERQRIPRSEVVFAGLTIRFLRVDSPLNPRRGLQIETRLERGRKISTRLQYQSATNDTTTVRTVVRQERLLLSGRLFIPTFSRQTFVVGNDTRVLASRDYDTSDLFRIGGAQSLRGYDEDRFRGRLVSRSLAEYRYLFDRESYAYLFFDLGYVDQPATPDFEARQSFYSGYGLGIRFETGIGLINTSLALSTNDNPSQARVHVGLSLGL